MYLYGGLSGILCSLLYGLLFAAPLEYVQFPVTASQPQIVLFFWAGPMMAVFGILNSYAIYRILAEECQGSLNKLAFLFSAIAFSLFTAMLMIQESVRITISDRWTDAADPALQDLYRTVYSA